MQTFRIVITLSIVLFLTACSNSYYSALEKVGVHKRDIFIDRVEEATQSQQDTKEQFRDALEKFSSVVSIPPGALKGELTSIKSNVNSLIKEMERSIKRSQDFVKSFKQN